MQQSCIKIFAESAMKLREIPMRRASHILIIYLLSFNACADDQHPFHIVQTRTESDRADRAAASAAEDAEKCRQQHQELKSAVDELQKQTSKLETTAAACER